MASRNHDHSIWAICFTYGGKRRMLGCADRYKDAMMYRRLCYEALGGKFKVDIEITDSSICCEFRQHEVRISDELIELLEGAYGCVFMPPATKEAIERIVYNAFDLYRYNISENEEERLMALLEQI